MRKASRTGNAISGGAQKSNIANIRANCRKNGSQQPHPCKYYKQEQTKQILQTTHAPHYRRPSSSFIKQLKQLAASDVNLTFDEAETLRDTSSLLAHEAAIMSMRNRSIMLTKSKAFVPSAKHSKILFYLQRSTEPQEAPVATAEPGQSVRQWPMRAACKTWSTQD